ncbi:MAG: hypothetical protein ACLQNE_43935 [Thermoguttaceae bacterium]
MAENTIERTLKALETKCSMCGGDGIDIYDPSGRLPCGLCNGAGFVPTERGETILSLISHNLRNLIEEIRSE